MALDAIQPHLGRRPVVILVSMVMNGPDVAQLLTGHVLSLPVPVSVTNGAPHTVVKDFQATTHAPWVVSIVTGNDSYLVVWNN